MKKLIVIGLIIVGLAIANLALAATYKTDLFDTLKVSNFRLDMSIKRAEVLFSDYELRGRTDAELEGNFMTILTYTTGEFKETVKLHFTNGYLNSFDYMNFDLSLKQLEIDIDFLLD
ncbi:hypothetical protein ES703_16289 [subsurface metagenome]